MKSSHKEYDDGRTVADMSGIEHQTVFFPPRRKKAQDSAENTSVKEKNDTQTVLFTKSERRAYIGGALAATLLVASVFILAAFLLIFLITKIG